VSRRWRDDSGQTLLLILVYALVAAGLVGVVTDASVLFLRQRALASAADAAALRAAQMVALPATYSTGVGEVLPIDPASAESAVDRYLAVTDAERQFPDLHAEVTVDGDRVTVRLRALAPLRFTGWVTGGRYADGAPLSVTAHAKAPLRR
jgi:hypothetical protein